MSVPNMITLVRIVLTPVFAFLYLEGEQGAALLVLALAALSDMLDGAIARRFGLITPLGKVLDPVADKVLQLAMMLCLVSRHGAVMLVLLLHLLRELMLGLMGALVYRRCGVLTGAHWYGKLCTGFMYTFLGLALLWIEMPEGVFVTGLYLCAGLILCCLWLYAMEYVKIIKAYKIKKPRSL